jgi:hypothetical protein
MATNPDNPVRNHYLHAPERIEEHKADLADQAKNPLIPREPYGEKVVSMLRVAEREEPRKRRGVVYERQRAGAEGKKEQPERLISVQDAGDLLNVPQSTIGYWIASGRIKERGRVWLARPGGRGIALVSESEVVSLKNERSPMGRIPQRRYKRGKGNKPQ